MNDHISALLDAQRRERELSPAEVRFMLADHASLLKSFELDFEDIILALAPFEDWSDYKTGWRIARDEALSYPEYEVLAAAYAVHGQERANPKVITESPFLVRLGRRVAGVMGSVVEKNELKPGASSSEAHTDTPKTHPPDKSNNTRGGVSPMSVTIAERKLTVKEAQRAKETWDGSRSDFSTGSFQDRLSVMQPGDVLDLVYEGNTLDESLEAARGHQASMTWASKMLGWREGVEKGAAVFRTKILKNSPRLGYATLRVWRLEQPVVLRVSYGQAKKNRNSR